MENNGIPLINKQMYGWAMVKAMIGGVLVTNMKAIDYRDDQDVVAVYGAGRYPIGYGKGRITCSGSITLFKEELVALQSSVPNGRIQDIPPFDITVTYLHTDSNQVVTDILKGCVFTTNETSVSEGDTSIETNIPLLITKIKHGKK